MTWVTLGWAHPRLRGEHSLHNTGDGPVWGSSPLTRGALNKATNDVLTGGLIPAYAGSTDKKGELVKPGTAHPRLRGEHKTETGRAMWEAGSSPLTRGAQTRHGTRAVTPGLIPAYAGSTVLAKIRQSSRRAHPRLRGEHPQLNGNCSKKLGSSPLTRGARFLFSSRYISFGLIPAYAGSTGP